MYRIIKEVKSFIVDIQKPENQGAAFIAWVVALVTWAMVVSTY